MEGAELEATEPPANSGHCRQALKHFITLPLSLVSRLTSQKQLTRPHGIIPIGSLAVVLPLQNEERSLSTLKRDLSGAPQVHLKSYGLRHSRSLSTFFVSGKSSPFKTGRVPGPGPLLSRHITCQQAGAHPAAPSLDLILNPQFVLLYTLISGSQKSLGEFHPKYLKKLFLKCRPSIA